MIRCTESSRLLAPGRSTTRLGAYDAVLISPDAKLPGAESREHCDGAGAGGPKLPAADPQQNGSAR
jgi:hypothetical protein